MGIVLAVVKLDYATIRSIFRRARGLNATIGSIFRRARGLNATIRSIDAVSNPHEVLQLRNGLRTSSFGYYPSDIIRLITAHSVAHRNCPILRTPHPDMYMPGGRKAAPQAVRAYIRHVIEHLTDYSLTGPSDT